MKMMTKFLPNHARSFALAVCVFAAGASPMWSQTPQDAPPPPPQGEAGHPRMEQMQEHRLEMMTRQLGLAPDQVTQIKAIDKDGMTQMMALRQDTSIPQADKREKMKAIHEGEQAKVRAVLTDEQKLKYDQMIARERERMERHGEHEGAPGQPLNPPPAPPA